MSDKSGKNDKAKGGGKPTLKEMFGPLYAKFGEDAFDGMDCRPSKDPDLSNAPDYVKKRVAEYAAQRAEAKTKPKP